MLYNQIIQKLVTNHEPFWLNHFINQIESSLHASDEIEDSIVRKTLVVKTMLGLKWYNFNKTKF